MSVQLVGVRLALNGGKHPLFASAVQNLAERYVDHREVRQMLCVLPVMCACSLCDSMRWQWDKAKALFEMLEEQFDVKTR